MARTIPPFAAIRAFEAASRLGKSTAAAEELGISPSAVSHQIRSLESYLNTVLFLREGNQTTLSDAGRQLLGPVTQALDLLDATFSEQLGDRPHQHLRIHMFQSLANLWFLPHLADLRNSNPDLRITIQTVPEQVTLSASDLDMAIVYAAEPPQDRRCVKLFDEVIHPVCSPQYLRQRGPFNSPEALLSEPLIQSSKHPDEWSLWFNHSGLPSGRIRPVVEVDNRASVLQAADLGLGWAIERRPFGAAMLANGTLVAPFGHPMATGYSYFLLTSQRAEGTPACRRFESWIRRLCADSF